MPIPWKKKPKFSAAAAGAVAVAGSSSSAISRLVSALRSKHRAASSSSPLVVQTGFPTSLADLVVKNRSRLKTHPSPLSSSSSSSSFSPASRKKKKNEHGYHRHDPPPPIPNSESGRRIESFSRPQSSTVSSDAIAESEDKKLDLSSIATVAIKTTPRCAEPDVPSAVGKISNFYLVPDREASTDKEKLCLLSPSQVKLPVPFTFPGSRRVGFPAKILLLLLIMAACTKELVMVITASAFALLLLEYIGSHLFPLLRSTEDSHKSRILPPVTEEGNFDCRLKGSSDFNSTTSREGTSGDESSNVVHRSNSESFSSELSSSASPQQSDKRRLISAEREDPSSTERNLCNPKKDSIPIKEKMKHWSKTVTSKFRATKGGKGGKDLSHNCSEECSRDTSTMRASEARPEGFGEPEEAFDDEGDVCSEKICIPASEDSNESLSLDAKNSCCVRQNITEVKTCAGHSFNYLVLIGIVLSGLIGGRIIALGVTVSCCYLVKLNGMSAGNRVLWQGSPLSSLSN